MSAFSLAKQVVLATIAARDKSVSGFGGVPIEHPNAKITVPLWAARVLANITAELQPRPGSKAPSNGQNVLVWIRGGKDHEYRWEIASCEDRSATGGGAREWRTLYGEALRDDITLRPTEPRFYCPLPGPVGPVVETIAPRMEVSMRESLILLLKELSSNVQVWKSEHVFYRRDDLVEMLEKRDPLANGYASEILRTIRNVLVRQTSKENEKARCPETRELPYD